MYRGRAGKFHIANNYKTWALAAMREQSVRAHICPDHWLCSRAQSNDAAAQYALRVITCELCGGLRALGACGAACTVSGIVGYSMCF